MFNSQMIKVIINADDFGYSYIFNKKILELLEKEFIHSTTVMTGFITEKQKDQVKKLITLTSEKNISVGLHVVFDLEKPLLVQAREQFQTFKKIFGFNPSHIDYHKHKSENCMSAINTLGIEQQLPVRFMKIPPTTKHTTHPVFGTLPFDVEKVKQFLEQISDGESCEIMCHPGEYDPESRSSFNAERKKDFEGITKIQEYFRTHPNIKNTSYNDL